MRAARAPPRRARPPLRRSPPPIHASRRLSSPPTALPAVLRSLNKSKGAKARLVALYKGPVDTDDLPVHKVRDLVKAARS